MKRTLLLALSGVLPALALATPSAAAVFSCDEAGVLAAVARGGGPHRFSCTGPTVVVTSAEITMQRNVILDGDDNLILDGNDDHPVLLIEAGVRAVLLELTISGGLRAPAPTSPPFERGGGIRNHGRLGIARSHIVDNRAINGGGGIYNTGLLQVIDSEIAGNTGGGIFSDVDSELVLRDGLVTSNAAAGVEVLGDFAISNSELSDNGSGLSVGGVQGPLLEGAGVGTLEDSSVLRNAPGGGVANGGALTISRSIIEDNASSDITRPGGILNYGYLNLVDSIVSGNQGQSSSGGIGNLEFGTLDVIGSEIVDNRVLAALPQTVVAGGVSTVFMSRTTIRNSLISGNAVTGSLGLAGGGAIWNESRELFQIVNTTISDNWVSAGVVLGSAIRNQALNDVATLELSQVTLADNFSVGAAFSTGIQNDGELWSSNSILASDCAGNAVQSGGGNLESPGDTCALSLASDQVDVSTTDLQLAALQDAGGATRTRPIGAGSVALDAGEPAECEAVDQRGYGRPVGSSCDAGAFELGAEPALDCSTAYANPSGFLPVDGEFRRVVVSGVDDPAGPPANLKITAVSQTDVTSGVAQTTCADARDVRGSRVFLRAETTPGSEGRRYDIEFKAKDHRGNACAGTVSVCVRNGFNACPDEPPTIESQSCKVSRRKSDCGLGGELVLVLPLWAWARHRRVRARR